MSSRQTFAGWAALAAASAVMCFSLSVGQEPRRRAANRAAAQSGTNRAAQPLAANRAAAQAAPARGAGEKGPATLLPSGPVLFVSWDGEAAHREAWEKTAAYQALYGSGLVDVAQKMFASLVPQQANEQAELFRQVSEAVTKNGLSIAVTLPPAEGPAPPWGVAVLPGGAGLEPRIAEAVRAIAQAQPGTSVQAEDRSGRNVTVVRFQQLPPAELGWWTEGDHLVVAAGIGAVNNAIAVAEGRAGDVTDSRLWQAYRTGKQPFEAASIAWLDTAKLAKVLGPVPVPVNGRQGPPVTIGQMAQATGLDGLKAVVIRSGFDGEATVTDVRVETVENPKGLLSIGHQTSMTLAELPPLPQKLNGFGAASFDPAAFFDTVKSTVDEVVKLGPPEAKRDLDETVGRVRETIGLNLKADLLEPLGHVMCVYNDSAQGPFGLGLTVAFSVDDADKLRTSLDTLLERAGRQFPPDQLSVRRTTKHGREIVTLEIAEAVANPSYVVTDKWLVVSIVPQAVETFLLRTDGKLPAWKAEGDLAKALQGVPKEFTRVSVSDPRDTYRLIGGLAPLVLPAVRRFAAEARPGGGEVNLAVAVADLPPAELIAQPLFPNVSVGYVENGVLVSRTRSSLPGLGFGDSGGMGPATTAVAVALLLPAVQQAREAARRTQSSNNLKQIGLALHNYHDVYGSFPAGTIEGSGEEPEDRRSWMVSILPFVEQAPLYQRFDQRQEWDSDANAQATATPLPIFLNPSDPEMQGDDGPLTHYVGLAGIGEDGPTLPANNPKAGVFGYDRTTGLRDITDGTSNTVAVSEATGKSTGPWAQGGKVTMRPLTQQPYINGPDGLGGYHTGGCQMLFADGSVRFISENVDPSVMEALTPLSGGEVAPGF